MFWWLRIQEHRLLVNLIKRCNSHTCRHIRLLWPFGQQELEELPTNIRNLGFAVDGIVERVEYGGWLHTLDMGQRRGIPLKILDGAEGIEPAPVSIHRDLARHEAIKAAELLHRRR